MRRTKIVCTIGPATRSREQLLALARGGMNVARLNLSHDSIEKHRETVRTLKALNADEGLSIAILLDTKGAEIRTGELAEPLAVHAGDEVLFASSAVPNAAATVIPVNYPGFVDDAEHAERIIVDSGTLSFTVLAREGGAIRARAEEDGSITSRRHVNIPGVHVNLPSLTEEDWTALAMGCEEGVDFVALSFIRSADEVAEVRKFISEHQGDLGIITKIETRESIDNLAAILAASDGIMVARGDLGTEVPYEQVPALQDSIVAECRKAGKPVIVATHMLESMIEHPLPTRAEVTDIAHAATSGADATMLSGETANGRYPLKALAVMQRVLEETEQRVPALAPDHVRNTSDVVIANAAAAVTVADVLQAKAIVVLTLGGRTAKSVSRFRPRCPIIACTDDPWVQRRLQLHYGVVPAHLPEHGYTDAVIHSALEAAKGLGVLHAQDQYVLISDVLQGDRSIGAIQARIVHE